MRDGTYYARHGAGLYGVDGGSHKTACAQSNNPYGHSDSCPCRASQSVPYMEQESGYEYDE